MNRTGRGQFQKGRSGNAGGRPKVVKPLQELARTHTEMAIRTLAHVARKGKNESARITAASMLLDRAFGKPPAAVDIRLLLDRLNTLSFEELKILEDRLVAMAAPQEDEESQCLN